MAASNNGQLAARRSSTRRIDHAVGARVIICFRWKQGHSISSDEGAGTLVVARRRGRIDVRSRAKAVDEVLPWV